MKFMQGDRNIFELEKFCKEDWKGKKSKKKYGVGNIWNLLFQEGYKVFIKDSNSYTFHIHHFFISKL